MEVVPDLPHREVLHFIGYNDDRGGIVAMIRALSAAARFRSVLGVNPGCVQHGRPPMPVMELPRIEGESINLANFGRAWTVARRVRDWMDENPHRVFHGHSRAGLLVALWLHLWGERRVVVSVHCFGRHRWFYRLVHGLFGSRLLWYSPAMKRHYGLKDLSWSGCMPNGLSATLPMAMRGGPASGTVLRLGGAGAMVGWKRWDLVLEALARLPASAKVRFIHIGGALDSAESRACERDLRAQTEKLGLSDRVEWRGWQPSSAALLAEVDAVVVPSDGEPFSMIALEAMFAGVPVIATRGGGPEDFVLEGVNGWLVPPGEAAALAARLESLAQPAAWAGLRVVPEHLRRFSMTETLAARWVEIYSSL
jgi:hypothetical protein